MELIYIVDSQSMKIKGFLERKWAEKNRLCHLTTLLIPVLCGEGKVGIQIRTEGKSFAGYRDFFGGHVSLDKEFWELLIGNRFDIGSIVYSAAVREANEELNIIRIGSGYPEIITNEHLVIIDSIGAFPWDGEQNVERSTLFLVKIPEGCLIRPMDDVKGKFVRVETEFLLLHEIQEKYGKREWNFADGAERILEKFKKDNNLLEKVTRLVAQMCSKTKQYFVVWEDWQDKQSHGKVIEVKIGEDPYKAARDFLDNYGDLLKFGYLIESMTEMKEGETLKPF